MSDGDNEMWTVIIDALAVVGLLGIIGVGTLGFVTMLTIKASDF